MDHHSDHPDLLLLRRKQLRLWEQLWLQLRLWLREQLRLRKQLWLWLQ